MGKNRPQSHSTLRLKWRQEIREGKVILCGLCGEPCTVKHEDHPKGTVSVDHIIPRSLGGSDARENLQPAHYLCNREKGAQIISKEMI